uniref:Lipocalin n=1 Tax=Rhipicephalus appendiculatus TaxID=34631 RepID=A0A131Z7H8_RHIAP
MLSFGITFALTLAIGEFLDVTQSSEKLRRPYLEDLMEALKANRLSWLKKCNYNEGAVRPCASSANAMLLGNECEFDYGYVKNGSFTKQHFYSTLSDSEKGPVMAVKREKGGADAFAYTMRYLNKEERCAIFTHMDKGNEKCELYMWDDFIEAPTEQCDQAYNRICKRTVTVYKEDCQAFA